MAIITDILALSPLTDAILSKLSGEALNKAIRALYHAGQEVEGNNEKEEKEGEKEVSEPEENLDTKDLKALSKFLTNEDTFEIVLETQVTSEFLKDERFWILKVGKNYKVSQIYSPKPKSSIPEQSRDIRKFETVLEALLFCKEQYDMHLSLGYIPFYSDSYLSDDDKTLVKQAWTKVNIGNKPSKKTKNANSVVLAEKRERESDETDEPAAKKVAVANSETDKPVSKDKEENSQENGTDEKSSGEGKEETSKKGKESSSKNKKQEKKPEKTEAQLKEEKKNEEMKRAELELEDLVSQPDSEGKNYEKYVYLDSAEPPLSFIIATLLRQKFRKPKAPFKPDEEGALMDCFFPYSPYLSKKYGVVGVLHVKYPEIVRFYEYLKQITAKDFQKILDSDTKWPEVLGGFCDLDTHEASNQEYFTIHFNSLRRFFYNAVKYGRHILVHC